MRKNEFNKGDRVYVSFDIVDYVIKDGNSHGELSGQFSGYGVLDRVEDGRVYGRRDDGIPFTCMVSDVTKIEPNPTKYDWSTIPAHVNWMATDEDGTACGWLVEPSIQGNAWRHQSHNSGYFYMHPPKNPYRGDWKQSLEKRPNPNKSGVRVITPSGESYVRAWDLASKDGEG